MGTCVIARLPALLQEALGVLFIAINIYKILAFHNIILRNLQMIVVMANKLWVNLP